MSIDPGFVVAIPARYASTRLPAKPLADIGGRPMIAHVVERARAAGAREVVVATDDARIVGALDGSGIRVCMTRADHASGSDRLAECAAQCGWDDATIVVNLQGDEPLAPAAAIRAVAASLHGNDALIGTLAAGFEDTATLFDPNCVKVVCDAEGRALYFSRAPIPWARDRLSEDRVSPLPAPGWLRHIGMYAYRVRSLREFTQLPPGRLERLESLEQLRALEAGWRIQVALTPVPVPAGVDTAEDLQRVRRLLAAGGD